MDEIQGASCRKSPHKLCRTATLRTHRAISHDALDPLQVVLPHLSKLLVCVPHMASRPVFHLHPRKSGTSFLRAQPSVCSEGQGSDATCDGLSSSSSAEALSSASNFSCVSYDRLPLGTDAGADSALPRLASSITFPCSDLRELSLGRISLFPSLTSRLEADTTILPQQGASARVLRPT